MYRNGTLIDLVNNFITMPGALEPSSSYESISHLLTEQASRPIVNLYFKILARRHALI